LLKRGPAALVATYVLVLGFGYPAVLATVGGTDAAAADADADTGEA
jgi:hypothetical protein